ncbi:MAG: transposase [Patescibacteria group bacterium]|jgi:REP element-mobilizing transposase RayT
MILHYRKLNRLKNYDYSSSGYYFVTICVHKRSCVFGKVKNNKMILNVYGEMAEQCWLNIPKHFPDVELDEFVIMPNHVHGIIIIYNSQYVGNKNFCSLQNNKLPWQSKLSKSLSSIIRGYKIGVTEFCLKNEFKKFAWQKSYYDHIICNDYSLLYIRQYIRDNPVNWNEDRNNI